MCTSAFRNFAVLSSELSILTSILICIWRDYERFSNRCADVQEVSIWLSFSTFFLEMLRDSVASVRTLLMCQAVLWSDS